MSREQSNQNIKKKRVSAGGIVSIVILLLAVALLAYAFIARVTGNPFSLFGFSFHVVVTDSMTGEIEVGDFIVAKKVPIESVEVDRDDVVYRAGSGPLKGQFIVHRVVEKSVDSDGKTVIRTQGIKPGAPLDEPVTEIVGKYVWKSAFLGKVFLFFRKPLNWIFIAIIAALIVTSVALVKYIVKTKRQEK